MPRINRAPAPEDIALGAVLWLPPKHEVEAALRKTNNPDMGTSPVRIITHPGSDPSESFYDHPIMVVSRPANDPDRIHFVPVKLPFQPLSTSVLTFVTAHHFRG